VIANYDLAEILADDGRYRLYRGTRRTDGLPALLKAPHEEPTGPADVAALERELALLQTLPKACTRLVELHHHEGYCALVFEDAGGILLSELNEGAPLDLATLLAIAIQLATVLVELHRRDVLHGSINPQNILVDPRGAGVQLIGAPIATTKSAATIR
jgi:serine/threonine protein kinase